MSQISQIKKIYHAAIYVRLSKEDGAVASHEKTESNSIANQKSLIRDFLKNKNDIEVVQEYVDDGFSGSNFERPAFQMMLEDIKKGKIDCVVTKDLSRFGREYIDSGMYIERLFPAMGVRFIAINDGIDSGEAKSQSDEIIIPFKNLINDAYCRDISIKIRSHLEIKRKQGDVITAFVPYGYKKNDKDKHKLEIDVYAANVVKDIFRMKLHGKSQDAIACELNSSGILPPAEYKASTGSNYQTCFKTKEKSEWTSVMVRRILTNEVYIGNLVQGKQTTPNHKVKKTIIKEKCEWIRIEKNHEPVIRRSIDMYTEKVMDHFQNPRNVGEIENASGVGTVGNAKCGDIMRIYLDIDENQIIRDVKFKTFGCGAAVATSSMATELVKGKSIYEALQVTNKAVMEALDGLPPVKVHCSLLAEEAIHAALWDYAKKHHIKIEGLEKPKSDIHEGEEEEEEEY